MSALIRRLTGNWRRPRSLIIAAAIAVFSASGLVAWAAWSSQGNGPGAAKSLSMPGGNTPTASVSGTTVTVGWAESDFANGAAVQGYRIQRYAQGSTTAIGPGAACSGTITVLTCAENAVPGGTWQYTVTPIQGSWTGAESAKSQPVTVSTGGPIATATIVTSSGTPSVFGQSVTFTATITPAPPANETVTFTDGASTLGTAPLNAAGTATLATNALTVGSHTISASYAGDSSFLASSGSTVQVVNKASTSVLVTSSDGAAVFGESISFTATVTATAPGAGTVDGTVQFKVDGVNLDGTVTLSGGTATSIATTTLSVGSHTVTAVYSGSANFNGATGTLAQTVGKAGTTTVVTSTPNPSVFGQMVTLTATVSAVAPGAGTPGGSSVTFTDGSNTLGTATLSGGTATFMTSALAVGSHTIGARYDGDPNFNGSTAAPITQVVGKADTTTVVTSSTNPSVFGQGVVFTATVAAASPGAGSPTGTVQFQIDGSNFGSPQTLLGGKAFSDSATALSVGSHAITATYSGDGNFNGSSSGTLTQTVNKADTTTVVTSPGASVFGQGVSFTATVSPVAPGAGTPGGTVQFVIDGTAFGSPMGLAGGSASSPADAALSVGTHTVIANYSGDGSFNASSSTSFTQTVNKADTGVLLTSSHNPSVFGEGVSFTATVTAVAPGAGTVDGSVQFKVDGTDLGSPVALTGGSASSPSINTLSVAGHTVTAVYSGSANFNGSTSTLTQTVGKAATTTVVTSSVSPSVFGQDVSFTASVSTNSPGSGTPDGTVQFAVDGTSVGSPVTLSGGTASMTISALSVGSHSIMATYSGSANFLGSAASVPQTVNKADTTTTLVSSINPSVFGQGVTFTATMSANAPGAGVPTGSVQFAIDGSSVGGAVSLSGGSATSGSISTLAVGTHSVTATYAGNGSFNGSTSSTLTQTVNKADAATSVNTSSANPSVFGQAVTFTALVTAMPPGAGTPTGTVQFSVDGVNLGGPATLSFGVATSPTTSSLTVGTHTVTASYSGDGNFTGSASPSMTQFVNKDATTTTIVSSANPALFGQSVTFTATVSANSPGSGTPSGTVTFAEGSTTLGTGTLSAGSATFTTSSLSVGNHTITAGYGGDGNFLTSSSSLLQAVGNQDPTTTSLSSSANPSVFSQSVTLTATVTVNAPGTGTPTGTVTFMDGTSTLGTGTLSGGTTTFVTSLEAATHSITASYGGDGNFASSVGTLSQTVNRADTTTSMSADITASVVGQPVTFTATVSEVAPATASPPGIWFLYDGPTAIAGGSVLGSISTTSLAPGVHSLTGHYNGTGNFNPSVSAAVTVTVSQASTTTALGSAPNPSVFGQNVTFTATVAVTSPGSGTPTGTVTFSEGSTTLGTGSLNGSGQATYATSTLSIGSHTVTASYGGDTNFTGSTSGSVAQMVNKVSTTTTVASSNNPSVAGQSVTFTASVAPVAPGSGTPTGTVDFTDGATSLGTGTLDSSGNASVTTSALSAGTHTITGTYNGDANFIGSHGSVAQAVNSGSATTTTALSASPSTPDYGQLITFTASVSSAGGSPSGRVDFNDGTTLLGSRTLDLSGHASLSTFRLALGGHSVTAVYAGDTNFAASTSNTLAFTMNGSCSINWVGGSAGNLWATPANWDLNRVPGAADHVCVGDTNPAITVDYNYAAGVTSVLSVVSFSSFTIDAGELDLTGITEGSYIDNQFSQTGGTLGGVASVTMNVGASWTGGTWKDAGTTTFTEGTVDAISGYVGFTGNRTVTNHGTVTHSYTASLGGGTIQGDYYSPGGGTIANTGLWIDDSSNGNLSYGGGCCGAVIAFNNSATLTQMGSGQTTMSWALNNTGTVNVSAGNLTAAGGGGTPAASPGASYSIAGTFEVAGGAYNIAAGNLTGTGTLKVSAGTLTLGTSSTSTASNINITGGTLNVNGTDSALSLAMSYGTLGGTGTLTLSRPSTSGDALTLTGGALQDTGTTIIAAGSSGTITGYESFTGNHVLTNHGTITHVYNTSSGGYVQGDSYAPGGGTIVNTGNWTEDSTNGTLTYGGNCCGAAMRFNNSGTLSKIGAGQLAMAWTLTNTLSLQVDAGTLTMSGGGGTPTGTAPGVDYGVAGVLEVSGGAYDIEVGNLSGNGTLKVSGGVLTLGTSSTSTASNINVTGGTMDVFGNDSALSLNQSGGAIGGTGTLTLTQAHASGDALTITGGTLQDAGTTIIAAGSSGTMSGYSNIVGNHVLSNHGTVVHQGAGQINGDNYSPGGGTIINTGSWTEDGSGGTLYYTGNCCGAAMAFNNSGTLTQKGGGQTQMYWRLTNTGAVNVDAGTLTARGGGGTPAGSPGVTYSITGVFEVAAGTYDVAAGDLSGAGILTVSGGTMTLGTSSTSTASNINLTGGTLNVNGNDSALSLNQSNGTLGGTGTLILNRPTAGGTALTLSGGTMQDAGTTILASGSTGTVTGYETISGNRSLINNGTVTHGAAGQINGDNYPPGGGTIVNNGSWTEDSSGGTLYYTGNCCGAAMAFNNIGTLTHTGTGQTNIYWALNNTGTVNVSAGTLTTRGGGGSVSGTSVSYTLTGTFEVAAGTYNIAVGNLSGSGTLKVSGGLLTLGTSSTSTASNINLTGGTLNVNGLDQALSLNQSAGTLGGTGTLTLTQPTTSGNALTFTGGTMQDAGNTVVASGSTGAVSGAVTIGGGRTLTNHGTVTHKDGGSVYGDNYAPASGTNGGIVNTGSWTEDTAGGALYYYGNCCGATMAFNNSGTLTHSGAGQTNMYWTLTNTGTLSVDAGTLTTRGGGGTPSGSTAASYSISGTFEVASGPDFNVAAGNLSGTGTIKVSGGSMTLGTSSTSTASNINLTGGTLTVDGSDSALSLTETGGTLAGAGTLTLNQPTASGVALTWTGGTMTSTGHTVVAAGSSGIVTGYDYLGGSHTLTNNGSVVHNGGGTVQGDNYAPSAGAIINAGNWTEDTSGGALWYTGNCCGSTITFNNSGTLTHVGAGQTQLYWVLNNTGTLDVSAGTLTVRDGGGTPAASTGASYSITGTFEVAAGPDFNVAAGNLSGTGTIKVSGGSMTLGTSSTSTLPNLNIVGGTLNVNGTDSAISLNDNGGIQGGTGTLTLTRPSASGNALTWSGGGMTDSGSTVLASGTSASISGYVTLTGRHTLTNNGTVVHSSGSVNGENYATTGTSGAIVNAGSWTEDTSAGGVAYSGNCCGATMVFTNNGTMSVNGHGNMSIGWIFANNGTLNIDAALQVSGGYTMSSTSTTNMTIAGTTGGFQYSQLIMSGAVVLQGTLNVTTPSTFIPPSGSTYYILQYGIGTTGSFTITYAGHTYTPTYTSSNLILTA